MKISTFILAFFLVASNLYSQKTIKNGVVDFEVTVATQGIPDLADSLFVPTKLSYTHYFSSNSFLLENMNQDTTLRIRHHRSKNGRGSYFFNVEDEHYKIDELFEKTYGGKKTVNKTDVKTIAGYNCYKETYFIADNNFIVLYVTKSIKPGFNYYQQIFPNLKGFPLEMTIHSESAIYKYTAKSVQALPENYPLLPDLQQYELVKEGKLKAKLMNLIGA